MVPRVDVIFAFTLGVKPSSRWRGEPLSPNPTADLAGVCERTSNESHPARCRPAPPAPIRCARRVGRPVPAAPADRCCRAGPARRPSPLTALAPSAPVASSPWSANSGGASAATVAITPLTPGKTLSGVIGKGGQSAVNSFASWRGRSIDVVVNYLGANTWNAITNVSGEALTKLLGRLQRPPRLVGADAPARRLGQPAAGANGDYDDKYKKVARTWSPAATATRPSGSAGR